MSALKLVEYANTLAIVDVPEGWKSFFMSYESPWEYRYISKWFKSVNADRFYKTKNISFTGWYIPHLYHYKIAQRHIWMEPNLVSDFQDMISQIPIRTNNFITGSLEPIVKGLIHGKNYGFFKVTYLPLKGSIIAEEKWLLSIQDFDKLDLLRVLLEITK